jgi:hypothetical protein
VVSSAAFYEQGSYYFTGVWSQAEHSRPPGQTDVLRALAPYPDGLALPDADEEALKALEHHDVLRREEDGRWRFTVELLRRWVAERL